MNIYFVRHGETDWNKEGKIQGSTDISLNNEGLLQAEDLLENIKDLNIELLICSPMKRAYETAQVVNKSLKHDLITDDRLRERSYGINEGKKKSEFDYDGFWKFNESVVFENSEEIKEFFSRIENFINDLKVKFNGKNVLIVSHNGVGRAFNYYFNEMTDKEIIDFKIPNGKYMEYKL